MNIPQASEDAQALLRIAGRTLNTGFKRALAVAAFLGLFLFNLPFPLIVLGAGALGDIGEHFPDTDEHWRDADSVELLRAVVEIVGARGLTIVNVDCTVIMEKPKLSPHRQAIRECLARALDLDAGRVNVKASTGEGIGFVGRGEGVAALAVASVQQAS